MLKSATLALAAAALAAPAFAAIDEPVRIATEGAYAPYNYKDSAGNLIGFEIDLYKELCDRMGVECEIVEQAWDGIIPALTAKKYDAIMAGMSAKAEREEVISFSRSYVSAPIGFATLKGNELAEGYSAGEGKVTLPELDNGEQAKIDALKASLEGQTVGVQGSTTHEDFMREYMADVDLKTYDTMENMILDLEAGRIDVAYSEHTFLDTAIEQNENIVLVGPGMSGGPLGRGVAVGIRQEDDELRAAFSEAINSMIEDGSLGEMAEKWFGRDISPAE